MTIIILDQVKRTEYVVIKREDNIMLPALEKL